MAARNAWFNRGIMLLFPLMACDRDRLTTIDECTAEAMRGTQETCSSPGNPLIGACRPGVYRCVDGKKDRSVCVGEVLPTAEVCDGVDNDCNGLVDDGVIPAADPRVGKACGQEVVPASKVGVGPCRLGTTVCAIGGIACDGTVAPADETCDGVDNDCNGLVDDGPNLFELCQSPDNPNLIGECRPGVYRCVHGTMDRSQCVGEVKPATESCNGKDDDCDGMTDEGCGVALVCPPDVTVPVGTPVTLTVTASSTGGTIAGYSWTALSGPPGGIGTPNQWNPAPPVAATESFLPMIVGVYAIHVTATDAAGAMASCDTRVTAVGVGLRVELTWDGSADMDLHVHDGATSFPWFSSPADCYYADRGPDWDVMGVAQDDAMLDVDNTSAFGPENVRIQAPVIGETYAIGVHNYSRGDGRIATVRIFCGTVTSPQATYVSRAFTGAAAGNCTTNDFWKVATVTFNAQGACSIALLDSWSDSAGRCAAY